MYLHDIASDWPKKMHFNALRSFCSFFFALLVCSFRDPLFQVPSSLSSSVHMYTCQCHASRQYFDMFLQKLILTVLPEAAMNALPLLLLLALATTLTSAVPSIAVVPESIPECDAQNLTVCDFWIIAPTDSVGSAQIANFNVTTTFTDLGGGVPVPFDAVRVAGSFSDGPIGQTTACNSYVSGAVPTPLDTANPNNVFRAFILGNFQQAQGLCVCDVFACV
jgi:hypothetical protein